MASRNTTWIAAIILLGLLFVTGGSALAEDGKQGTYPSMAPVEQYRIANQADEIALARSAAPASISNDAEILILGAHGYEVAIKGKNGFACLVERSWLASFEDDVFWNPKIRGPDCLNAAAVNTVLPAYLERTKWAMEGASKADMAARAKASSVAHQVPAAGAIGYMMSQQGHLSDTAGHWHPHLMLFQPHTDVSAWGANLSGSPVKGQAGGPDESSVIFIVLGEWSDGTPASMKMR